MQEKNINLQTDIIVADLIKGSKATEQKKESNSKAESFFSLGYYDSIRLHAFASSFELQRYVSDIDINTERVIFIPVQTQKEDCIYTGQKVGAISFLLLKEEEQSLFSVAKEIEGNLKDRLSCLWNENQNILKCFVCSGASGIAVLMFVEDNDKIRSTLNGYIDALKTVLIKRKECIYSFTCPIIPMDAPEKNQSIIIENLHMSISRNMMTPEETFTNKLGELRSKIGGKAVEYGNITGSDDYFIHWEDVSYTNLYNTLSWLRESTDDKKFPFDSTFTTLLFSEDAFSGCGVPFQADVAEVKEESDRERSSEDDELIKLVSGKQELQKYMQQLSEFLELRSSKYTDWVYWEYHEIVYDFCCLLVQAIKYHEHYSESERDTNHFFQILSEMLESLLNTSACFTDSPGYRRVENNSVPRWILYYQTIIHSLVVNWDDATRNRSGDRMPNRKHSFILATNTDYTIDASMYFSFLPPDERVIYVRIPIFQAFQPSVILPKLIHEVGHYIGVRRRNEEVGKSRRDLFIRLSLQFFINEVIDNMEKLQKEKAKRAAEEKKQDDVLYFARLMLDAAFEYVLKDISEQYSREKEWNIQEIDQENKNLVYAMQENYLQEMKVLLAGVYRGLLLSGEDYFRDLCYGFFMNVMQRQNVEREKVERAYNRVYPLFSEAIMDLSYSFLEDWHESGFLADCEKVFSEVTADVFMSQIIGMNREEYAILFFEDYVYNTFYEYDNFFECDADICPNQIIATPTTYYRLVSMYANLPEADEACYEKKRLEVIVRKIKENANEKELGKIKEKYAALKAFLQTEVAILEKEFREDDGSPEKPWKTQYRNHWKPYYTIKEYVECISSDDRYHTLEQDLHLIQTVKEVRTLYEIAKKEVEGKENLDVVLSKLYEVKKQHAD